MGGCSSHDKERFAIDFEDFPANQMKDLWAHLVDMSTMPGKDGKCIQAWEAFVVAIAEQGCPRSAIEPIKPFFLLPGFFLVVPDKTEVAADNHIIIFCHFFRDLVVQKLADVDRAVGIACNVDHLFFFSFVFSR